MLACLSLGMPQPVSVTVNSTVSSVSFSSFRTMLPCGVNLVCLLYTSYSKEELAGLAAVLAKYPQVVVIADEIYEHINYIGKHQSIAQFPEMKERTVIVNGVSKAYAMTGWRIGFIAGPEWLVKACNKLQGQYTSCLLYTSRCV